MASQSPTGTPTPTSKSNSKTRLLGWAGPSKLRFKAPRRRRGCIVCLVVFLLFSLIFLLSFFFAVPQKRSSSNNLSFGRPADNSPLNRAPWNLVTAGVLPRRVHSHNDYLQDKPLFEALSFGVTSIEADIWLENGQLLIGHEEGDTSPDRTLNSLYLDPLESLLDSATARNNGTRRGVFDTALDLPLLLFIDIKTDGDSTFPVLSDALSSLRSKGYLTTFNSSSSSDTSTPTWGPITVVGTGNTPLSAVQSLAPRDIFFDGPLADLSPAEFTPSLSPIASGSFEQLIGTTWLPGGKGQGEIRTLIEAAHAKGIMTRFWATPAIPTWVRNRVWSILLDAGTDYLNADDLAAAVAF